MVPLKHRNNKRVLLDLNAQSHNFSHLVGSIHQLIRLEEETFWKLSCGKWNDSAVEILKITSRGGFLFLRLKILSTYCWTVPLKFSIINRTRYHHIVPLLRPLSQWTHLALMLLEFFPTNALWRTHVHESSIHRTQI